MASQSGHLLFAILALVRPGAYSSIFVLSPFLLWIQLFGLNKPVVIIFVNKSVSGWLGLGGKRSLFMLCLRPPGLGRNTEYKSISPRPGHSQTQINFGLDYLEQPRFRRAVSSVGRLWYSVLMRTKCWDVIPSPSETKSSTWDCWCTILPILYAALEALCCPWRFLAHRRGIIRSLRGWCHTWNIRLQFPLNAPSWSF